MAIRDTDRQYYGGPGQQNPDPAVDPGYYQHISLGDLVNNFMVQETSEGMDLAGISQTLVEYHAQRGIQELTYDTLRTVKSYSESPEGDISVMIPQDAVGLVAVYWADQNGNKRLMTQRRHSGNPITPLLDGDGERIYDAAGNETLSEQSQLVDDFNRHQQNAQDSYFNYYFGSFQSEEVYERYSSYYGRRFGSTPENLNTNGTYVYDEEQGRIYIDTNFAHYEIIIDYVSDGLGDDISQIKVHKFAEEAIYNYIRHMILSRKMNTPLYEKQLAKKEYSAAKRRAKHRLSNISPDDIYATMLNKQKWIKR